MTINNKGFFMPSVMVYIMLFLMLTIYLTIQIVGYGSLVNNYQKYLYFEQELKNIEQDISSFVEAGNYDLNCKFPGSIKKNQINQNYKIKYYCIENIPKLNKSGKLKKNMEISVKEYNDIIQQLDNVYDEAIEKGVEIFITFAFPELKTALKVADKVEDAIRDDYYIFDCSINYKQKEQRIMIYYNYSDKEIKWLFYT